jgi:excisionase family DNA binding protein
MENLVLTQLSIPEIRQLFRQELQTFFDSIQNKTSAPETDDLLTIQQAALFLKLSVPTLYSLVSRSSLPVSKRGKRLYFSKQELTDWIKAGRKKTQAEIQAEANAYLQTKRKRG